MEPYLKSKVTRDTRSELSNQAAIERIKKKYGFKEKKKNLNIFYSAIDSSLAAVFTVSPITV